LFKRKKKEILYTGYMCHKKDNIKKTFLLINIHTTTKKKSIDFSEGFCDNREDFSNMAQHSTLLCAEGAGP